MQDRFEDIWLEYLSTESSHRPQGGGTFEIGDMSKRPKPEPNELLANLANEFKDLISNKQELRTACEKFLNNVVDELTLGIIFDYHRKYKTNAFDLDAKNCASGSEINEDIFTHVNLKKTQDCICPICDKSVGASRFAPHLEKCMGMGRSRSRNARRMVTNANSKEKDNNTNYIEMVSDDEDTDWNPRDKRRKKKDRNGKKKTKGGTPKKGGDPDTTDSVSIDIEGDEEDLSNLRDLLQDHSNSSSPAESVASSHSSSARRRDKSKNKKNRRDRSPASLD